MQAFLDYVVKGLVDRPEGLIVYELRLHPTDVGKIIGRQGATIQAIRSLMQVSSAKKGVRCAVEIVEERPEP